MNVATDEGIDKATKVDSGVYWYMAAIWCMREADQSRI